jgi:hypothetical protein
MYEDDCIKYYETALRCPYWNEKNCNMWKSVTDPDQQYHTSQTCLKGSGTDDYCVLFLMRLISKIGDYKVQKNNCTLKRKFCMNCWAKSVQQLTYKSVLFCLPRSAVNARFGHIHRSLIPGDRLITSNSCYHSYSSNLLHCAWLTLLYVTHFHIYTWVCEEFML